MKFEYVVLVALCLLLAMPNAIAANPTPLEVGIKLRAAADGGDTNSMLLLAKLLTKHAPKAKRPLTICDGKLVNPLVKRGKSGKNCRTIADSKNKALLEEWSAVGTRWQVSEWITKAARGGNAEAIEIKCGVASDKSAPADMREQAQHWCSKR